jgi:putative ABC transport system permease protein
LIHVLNRNVALSRFSTTLGMLLRSGVPVIKSLELTRAVIQNVIMEEAIILATIGFWPGLLLSELFYQTLAHLTNIPIFMTAERAVVVFFGTIAACGISGVLAMRKLAAADPADLF